MLVSGKSARLVLPNLAFVGLLSLLGHKEWRFIIYSVPMLNIAALYGLQALYVVFFRRRPLMLNSSQWLYTKTIKASAFARPIRLNYCLLLLQPFCIPAKLSRR